MKQDKGITLIALVITIIILLILAGISIAMLTGENGILTKATQASEKYKIETAREKIQLAVISYEMDKEKTTLYDELRKVEGLTYISPNGENKLDGPPYTVVVDGYEFLVQYKEGTEALEVIYIGEAGERKEAPEIKVEYDKEKVENLEMTIVASTNDEEGLKQIIVSKKQGEGENIQYDVIAQEDVSGKEATIKVVIPANGEYVIQVIGQNDMVTQKEIAINNIVNATIVAMVHAGEVIDNHVVITAKAQNTEIPIKAMEIYVDGKKVQTYEYEDTPMEKEETYTITNMEFYKNIPCYVKVLNTKGKEATSTTITTMNQKAIATATDLKNLATQVNSGNVFRGKTLQLIADINLNGSSTNQWTPIGDIVNTGRFFDATFEGNNHTIRGLYINVARKNAVGLFGENLGTIQNLKIEQSEIKSTGDGVGLLVAINGSAGRIKNITTRGTVNGYKNVGGIVGSNQSRSCRELC